MSDPAPDPERRLSDAKLEELKEQARITPEDIERAKQAWRRHARPAFRSLLDAEPTEKAKSGVEDKLAASD